jgi:parallel beta-helix repeat protein
MYWISRLMIAAAAAALVFAAAPSQAQICVNPSKSSCESTIQAGVDAANAGETVQIQNGTYFENVDVPAGKDGLILRGGKGAILDPDDRFECSATPTACVADADCPALETCSVNVGTGPGLTINSNSVVVRGFTIRNGSSDGIFVAADVTGTLVSGMTISGPDDDCIDLDSGNDNSIVEKSILEGCGGDGVESVGGFPESLNVQVIGNSFSQIGDDGADINGDGTIFEKNRCNNIDGHCAELNGDLVEVVNNRCEGCNDVATVVGNDALVDRNRGSNLSGGIDLNGDDPIVTNNRIDGTSGPGFDIVCTGTSCSGGLISKNRVSDSRDAGFQLDIGSLPPSTLVVENNTVTDVAGRGIDAECIFDVTLDKNKVDGTDDGGGECFYICGDSNTLSNNSADNCAGDGFYIDEDVNTLDRNKVKNALRNGFSIWGDTNTLTDNSATDTNGVGFAIETDADGTTLGGNKASKNRVAACNEGTNTTGIADNDFDQVVPRCPTL